MTERGAMASLEGQHVGLGEVARRYFERGWHPIELPAGEKGPPPLGRTGGAGEDMTLAEVLAASWAGNIGIRMPRDVVGLDVDAYRGGNETYADLVARLGPLPPTSIVHSDRGDGSGTVLYRVPVDMVWVATLAGVDIIQRRHRYLCVPPSVHPDGRIYGVFDQAEHGPAELRAVEDLPDLPWSWQAHLQRAVEGDRVSHAVGGEEAEAFVEVCTDEDAPGYLSVLLDRFEARRVEGYSRHDTMQHVLIWAMESTRAGLFSAGRALDALASLWSASMRPEEGRRAQLQAGHRVTEWQAMVRHAVGKAEAKTPEEMGKLRDDVVGPVFNVPIPPPSPEPGPEPEPTTSPFWLDWTAFAHRDADRDRWLVEQWWPAGRSMALWAAAKTGKSELALWVACQLALGRHPWTGAPAPSGPLDVAYFDFEMTEDDLEDRLSSFDIEPEDLGRLHYALLPPLHALDVEQGGGEVEALVGEVGARAVVFDTFGRAVQGEEDKADTVRAFYRYTGSRLKAAGVGYVRLDHAGKNLDRGQRGSSAKRDDVDVVWRMARSSAGVVLDCSGSSRVGWVPPVLRLDRVEVDEVVSYRSPIRFGPSRSVIELAQVLDAQGIDPALGWRDLRALGVRGRNATVVEVQRLRRERSEWSGTGPSGLFSDEP